MTENKHIALSKVAQCIWLVKPSIGTVMAQTVSRASYLYIACVKLARKGIKHKIIYAHTCVSQILSANMTFGKRALKR